MHEYESSIMIVIIDSKVKLTSAIAFGELKGSILCSLTCFRSSRFIGSNIVVLIGGHVNCYVKGICASWI